MGLTSPLQVFGVTGIPEVRAGDDLATLVGEALDGFVQPGDVLVVTSKVVSKAEGRQVAAADREAAITAETVRLVARGGGPDGPGTGVRIVENRQGLVLAAAGVDASNVDEGTVLLLPVDPDASAAALCRALRTRWGFEVGVVISDTLGRAWREGQIDQAIGAAGVTVLQHLQGTADANGRVLAVTSPAIGDELASAADLVKGKATGMPVALVRGLAHHVIELDELGEHGAGGARVLQRPAERDLFHLGAAEADAAGYARGFDAGLEEGMRAAFAHPELAGLNGRHLDRRAPRDPRAPMPDGTPMRRATDLPRTTSTSLPGAEPDYERPPMPPLGIADGSVDPRRRGEDGGVAPA